MDPIQTAAYDPIFWLHHSFIDKVWAERQNNPDMPQMTNVDLGDEILEPFEGNYTAIPYRESTEVYREIPVIKTDPCNENRGSL